MRLGLFSILSLAALANAKLVANKEHRDLKANDVGALHTDAFEQLAEVINGRDSISDVDMMMEVSKISASYCPPTDGLCLGNAYKATVSEFKENQSGYRPVVYPKDFNPEVRVQMNKMHKAMANYDGSQYEKVMDTLGEIQDELEDMKDVDTASQVAGITSVSVAMESTKLWTSAYSEVEHPLHDSLKASLPMHEGHRKLDIVYEDVILADVNSTLSNSIALLKKLGTDNPFSVFAVPPVLFVSILQYAVPASVIAAYPEYAPAR